MPDGGTWHARAERINFDTRNVINGERAEATGSATIDKFCPRSGALSHRIIGSSASDVDRAVTTARDAFLDGRWSLLAANDRKIRLLALLEAIESDAETLALLETLDTGKPISDALSIDVPLGIETLRFFAEIADKHCGTVYGDDPHCLAYQVFRPIGVVAAIVGWNFPLVLAICKVAPALAAGNSVVLKPSEFTSFSAGRIAELALKAGIPPGVFNVVHGGAEVGERLAMHEMVNLITFTGSTKTGKQVLAAAGRSNMKRVLLECGGKAANILFDDALDLDAVATSIAARAFWNQGQVCTASSRLLVQEGIKDEFLDLLMEKVSVLDPGDPLCPATRFGALVSESHLDKVRGYVDDGKAHANLLYRGSDRTPVSGGYYHPAVVFDGVDPCSKIAQEEIFGPVLSVIPFREEADAIAIANNTIYGLSAIAWTQNVGRARRLARKLDVGSIAIHATSTPQGGPTLGLMPAGGHKQSGIGVEGGLQGLEEYLLKTSVQIHS